MVAGDRAGVGGRRRGARGRRARLEHGDADARARRSAASASHSSAPSPSSSRNSAIERTSALGGERPQPAARRRPPPRCRYETTVCSAQPAPRGERVDGEVAALGDDRDGAGLGASPACRPTSPRGRADRHDAVAVRAAHRQLVAAARPRAARPPAPPRRRPRRSRPTSTTAPPQPRRARRLDRARHGGGRDRDDDGVDGLGQVGERRHARAQPSTSRWRGLTPYTAPVEAAASRGWRSVSCA